MRFRSQCDKCDRKTIGATFSIPEEQLSILSRTAGVPVLCSCIYLRGLKQTVARVSNQSAGIDDGDTNSVIGQPCDSVFGHLIGYNYDLRGKRSTRLLRKDGRFLRWLNSSETNAIGIIRLTLPSKWWIRHRVAALVRARATPAWRI
jgi:hypothetical protein